MAEAVILTIWTCRRSRTAAHGNRPRRTWSRDEGAPTGWRVDDTNRRPSRLLLPPKIRAAVDAGRDGGYAGASEVTRRLFAYWFDEGHEVAGFDAPFRYWARPKPCIAVAGSSISSDGSVHAVRCCRVSGLIDCGTSCAAGPDGDTRVESKTVQMCSKALAQTLVFPTPSR